MGRPPRRFGNYVLQRELDGDARHEVFLAEDDSGAEAILAFVNVDDATAIEIRRDLEHSSKLKHPAILSVSAMVEENGRRALVHPAVNGRTLARLAEQLTSDGEWMADVAIFHVGQQIAAALATAQRATPSIVHGCLTPERIIITWEGKVQLLGLGAAAALPDLPAPPWGGLAAPEVRDGAEVTPEANTYALGAILWWLATKTKPPRDGIPPPLKERRADLSAIVHKAIERALQPDPGQRGKAAMIAGALMREAKGGRDELKWNMEVFQALDRFDDVLPSSVAFPTSVPPRSGPPPSSRPPAKKAPKKLQRGKQKPKDAKGAAPRPRVTLARARDEDDDGAKVPTRLRPPPTDIAQIARLLDGPASDEASTKRRGGMFDLGRIAEERPPDSDRTARMSMTELETIALREQRTTHVGTLEEIERELDEQDAASTKRSRETSPDIDIDIDIDEQDEALAEDRAAMFPTPDSEPPISDDEPTKRVPLEVLKARAAERAARQAAQRPAGQPVLLGSAADPGDGTTPPSPVAPPRPPMGSMAEDRGPSLSFTLIIAITAIAAFSAGIFVVRGLGDDPEPPVEPTSSAPTPARPASPTPPPTTARTATARSTASVARPPPTAPSASAASSADALPTPPHKHGLIRVSASKAGATVYYRGKVVGLVGDVLIVPCGTGFVRLGDDPLTKWYNDGRVVAVPCKKELAEIAMVVKPAHR